MSAPGACPRCRQVSSYQDSTLSFINENRLRNSVKELEKLQERHKPVAMRDAHGSQVIKDYIDVDVTRFEFGSAALAGVLDRIRNRLFERMNSIRDQQVNR
jgi:hypothetical protein